MTTTYRLTTSKESLNRFPTLFAISTQAFFLLFDQKKDKENFEIGLYDGLRITSDMCRRSFSDKCSLKEVVLGELS